MRDLNELQREVKALRSAIRGAYQDNDELEAEALNRELDDVLEELYEAQRVLILR